ncbi:MAG: glycosyltransferase family 4 protein [Lentisphaeraceae bacterium]|nr:glycosyltransferase family 4 protein [Lentisphaeraceae bacterium]
MRVLYFHQHFNTPNGSVGTRSYEFSKKLIERGHSVTVVCGRYKNADTGLNNEFTRGKREGKVDGINIIEFDLDYSNSDGFVKRSVTFLKFALRSIVVALTGKYDLVFATSTPLTAGIPGICARWLRLKPFVFEVRDLWPELPREMGVISNPLILWTMSVLEWVSYKSAHHCIALSPGIVEGICKKGVPREMITMIPNGCDLSIFSGVQSKWRPKAVAESDFLAIYTGAHGMANGLDAVLDAAKIMLTFKNDRIKILLVGNGKLKSHLQERVQKENITNVFFHDSVSKKELAGLMAGADIGLQVLSNVPAFYYGTSPNKFFDYLSASLPVLTNYPGWVADLISKNDCGFIVPPLNAEAFAKTIVEGSKNREKLTIKGRNSLRLAETKFNRHKLSEEFVTVCEMIKN